MSREPGQPLPTNSQALVAAANEQVRTVPLEDAAELLDDAKWLFVDIRDPRELAKLGTIPGAFRAPRGMLEFWVDPESPYYKPGLDDGRHLLLFCGSGWRSALAAASLISMGREDVAHLEGGFNAWAQAGHPTEEVTPKAGS